MVKINFNLEKKHILFFVGLVVIIGLGFVLAQIPNPGHDYTQIRQCEANKILKMNPLGDGWTCGDDDVGITQIIGGIGISVNGETVSADTDVLQKRVGSCAAGSSIRVIDASGGVTCEPDDVNDADADPNNEKPIAGIGISVSDRTVSANCNAILGHNCGVDNVGITFESDPQVGETTINKWCVGSGTQVVCNQNAPSTTITNVEVSGRNSERQTAYCPSGKKVAGGSAVCEGGCDLGGGYGIYNFVRESKYVDGGNGWTVLCGCIPTSGNIYSIAHCV